MYNNIFHITTVHKRHDVRVYLKEFKSLSKQYECSLVVSDGLGSVFNADDNSRIVDIGVAPGNRLVRVVQNYRSILDFANKHSNVQSANSVMVAHFHDPENLFLAYMLSKRGWVVVWDSHEDFPRQLLFKTWIPLFIRKPFSFFTEMLENFVVKRISGVVAATPLIEERFKKLNPNTVCVKNYPILDEFIGIPFEKKSSKVICYIGSINFERGIKELLDALVVLGADYKLILCGVFDAQETENYVRAHAAWAQLDYRGMVDREGVCQALADSNVGMVTLHPSPNQFEALPIKLFEYMAAGLPVVASNFPLWESIVNEAGCGKLVDPLSVKEIAVAIRDICENVDLSSRYARAGREAALANYSWASEEKVLLKFYEGFFADAKSKS
ncbi:Phosphatidyl-myo-inositol mannosyltransferase [Hydrogenovibrio crunogenus]|uniref:Phosphatidyl-myo-inositol mannosyltransferase n=1 Tax=Hydrogenovibrio crunogenus TaxID=39765 RepID=A0A4V1C904_9GAMM|nr:glycosyltransferase [Hydrogenovibrio crunogenus]QBZ83714.1 Phosphatidyl-myo-inositol mannosyltransferase [Hydrogenovibrio crunogenus]